MAPRGASSRGEMDSARHRHSPTPFLQRGSWATTQRAPGSQGWDVGEVKQGQGCQVTWQISPLASGPYVHVPCVYTGMCHKPLKLSRAHIDSPPSPSGFPVLVGGPPSFVYSFSKHVWSTGHAPE